MFYLLYRINYKLIKTCNLMFSLPIKVAIVCTACGCASICDRYNYHIVYLDML